MPSVAATPEQFASYLTDGYWAANGVSSRSWSQDTITYSLSNEFSADQKAGLSLAFDLWSDVADINFTQVASGGSITIDEGDDSRAYSSATLSGSTVISDYISIDTNISNWSDFNDPGDYALTTAIHEIGHALGLGHTGNYNGSATYNSDAQWTNDSHQMTVMSYFTDDNVGSDHFNSTNAWQYSATPMLIDILAIQNIYGADYGTRSGNTTYGFNSNAGRKIYDFSISEAPIAIWDGDGIDTIDLSGYSTSQTIYLTEGDFSSVGFMTNNMVIAYGATIENAIGGTGADTIYGNDANNVISGGQGNDIFYGSLGNDTIEGGAGTDLARYTYAVSDFVFDFINTVKVAITHTVQNFTDTLNYIENFIFNGVSYTFAQLKATYGENEVNGNSANNTLYGTAGADHIRAAGGNDIIYSMGGRDIIDGGDGTDTVSYLLAASGVRVGLASGRVSDDGDGSSDTLIDIENIVGSNFADSIFGDDSNTLSGGGGNDKLFVYSGTNTINGGDGNDQINARTSGSINVLNGNAGDDTFFVTANATHTINGGTGNNMLSYAYDNTAVDINLTTGDIDTNGDNIADSTLSNIQNLQGSRSDDTLTGNNVRNIIYGKEGDDTINGGGGNDKLNGDNGNDVIHGGDGNDTISGGYGDDILYGDDGFDSLAGGQGMDTFIFEATSAYNNRDRIQDFTLSHNDRLDISDLLSGYDPMTDLLTDFVQITNDGRDSYLAVDADGGGDSFVEIAVLWGISNIDDEIGLEASGHLII